MARSKEELLKLGEIDPEFQKAIPEGPLIPMSDDFLETRENRAAYLAALRKYYPISGPLPGVREEDRKIPMRDGAEIVVRIYSPDKVPEKGSPLIVMYHEGGWCMGDLTDEDQNCRMFCKELGAVCLNVDYRLAPEYKFPIGVNDAWDALKWAAGNVSSLKASPKRGFIVGGSSAGGNIAAIMTHLARDENLMPPLTGQYLSVPALLPDDSVPEKYKPEYLSREANTSDPVLRGLNTKALLDVYGANTSSPLFAPFNHPKGHKNVPGAYFQLCGMDPLRDEGLIYERVLREEYGIKTRLNVYAGYGHMFWTNFPKLSMSKKFVMDTLEGFKWLLAEA